MNWRWLKRVLAYRHRLYCRIWGHVYCAYDLYTDKCLLCGDEKPKGAP